MNIYLFAIINIIFLKFFLHIENLKIIKLIILYNIYILVFSIMKYKYKFKYKYKLEYILNSLKKKDKTYINSIV